MVNVETLKKEIDTSRNEILEVQEMEEFLKSEENIKNLWEAMNSNSSQELLQKLENVLKDLCDKILSQPEISENQQKILDYFVNKFWDKYPEIKERINKKINSNKENWKNKTGEQTGENEENPDENISAIQQEIDNEIDKMLQNIPLNNLQDLWIDVSLQNNKKFKWIIRKNVINDIKKVEDLSKITEDNINQYISIPDNIPKENYTAIAENVKQILYRHLQLHPGWKTIIWNEWYSTWMSLEATRENDKYEANLHNQIQKLQKRSLDIQINTIVKDLPNNSDLLDLWLKTTLNSKKFTEEEIQKKLFDKIPVNEANKFFQTCKKNSFINELKNNYALYRLNKNNCIKIGDNYCFLDRENQSNFKIFKNKWIELSKDLKFDELYNHTEKFYNEIKQFWFDATIPLNQIMIFFNNQKNYYEKIRKASDICEKEIKQAGNNYNPGYMPVGWSPSAGHAYLSWEIHAAKVKFKSEKSKACAELEKEYVKVLLQKKPKPTWEIMWISGAWITLKFNKDPWSGSLDTRADKIVRDTFTEKLWDQREKFKYDLKNDRQAAFGSAMWMIGWIAWASVATIFSWNILATSAWFTAWLRLWNWVWQELWNSWEFFYEQVSWNTINDWNNKVENFWQWFLRWVWALDQNYEYVWTNKFLSWLWFDYLSTAATFWLSQKFWWFLWKLEWVKFAWWALKFWMEELILENFFVDIPMNVVQTWIEAFTWINNWWVTVWNTSMWNERTIKWEKPYESWSLSDMLKAMKDATTQNLSFENLSQTFFNTIIYWWFLEWWWAAIKKMKWYLPTWQVSNFTEKSTIAATAFAWLANFMSSKNINFNKDWKCIDTSTNLEITELDPRFKELCEHLNTVNATKAWVIESFEAIRETQKQMVADPENKTGLLFRLWLISPTNTPLNILKKKKELVEKKLNEAKSKWDNTKVNQLQKLLDIYTDAESRLSSTDYSNWESHEFETTETQAHLNGEKINNILKQINQKNESEKMRELRNEIEKQYKERKKEEKKLNITDEQLLSLTKIIDLDYINYIIDWIYYYKIEYQPKKHEATHIQETGNRLNELITESDKPKLNQKWFKKEYPDEQCENDVQRFIKRAQEKEIAHKQIFLDLGKEANAQALFIWPPKAADRIVDKVKNEYLAEWEGWLENITDFTRSTLLFDNYSEFVKWIEVLKQMQKEWRIAKLRIKNRINIKWCNDMLINIETADWYVSEVQFHIPETLVLKDGFLWPQVEKLYKEKFNIEFDKYIFTEKIYDLESDNEYQNKKNKYEKIIETINNKKDKKLKLPEQWKEIHWHDIYDIIRILDKRQNDPDLIWELEPDDVISLNKTLKKINDSLADEARNRYANRTI